MVEFCTYLEFFVGCVCLHDACANDEFLAHGFTDTQNVNKKNKSTVVVRKDATNLIVIGLIHIRWNRSIVMITALNSDWTDSHPEESFNCNDYGANGRCDADGYGLISFGHCVDTQCCVCGGG